MDETSEAAAFERSARERATYLPRAARGGWTAVRCAVAGLVVPPFVVLALSRRHVGALTWCGVAAAAAMLLAIVFPGGLFDAMRPARPRNRDAPWLADHRWHPAGESVSAFRHWRRLPGARGRAFLAPTWLTLPIATGAVGAIHPGAAAGLVALIASGLAFVVWRFSSFGTSRLEYAKFPFHPGEKAVLHFGMSEGGATFETVSLRLHRVVEVAEGPLRLRRCSTQPRLARRDVRPPGALPGPEQFVEIAFDVPADASGTRLSSRLPEYWALDVFGKTTAGWYAETFLVPIYERPAAVGRR